MWANELAQRCDCEEEQCHSPENMKIPGELIIIYYMSHIYIISMIRNFFSGYMALAENVFMECNHPPKAINAVDAWKKSPGHNRNVSIENVFAVCFN